MSLKNAVLIVASGRGSRIGGDVPKQYQHIGGAPMLRHTMKRFVDHDKIDGIIVVIHPDDVDLYKAAIAV